MLILSCNHKVESFDDAYNVSYKSSNEFGDRAIDVALLCKKCYDEIVEEGLLVDLDEEAEKAYEWLNGEEQVRENGSKN